MTDFLSPERTHSVVFRPNGIYYGTVVQIDEVNRRVWVTLPRVTSTDAVFGGANGCPVAGSTLPVVGDTVACVWAENRTEQLIVLGTLQDDQTRLYAPTIIATSETRPDSTGLTLGTLLYETDTGVIRVWDGTDWRGLRTGSGSSAGAVYFDEAGLGVGAPTKGQPLSVTKTVVFPAALSNASSGVAQFGAVTGANLVFDRDLIQARNNGSAATLRLNPLGGNVSGSFSATDLVRGTVPSDRMTGTYSGITGIGLLTTETSTNQPLNLLGISSTQGSVLRLGPRTAGGYITVSLSNDTGNFRVLLGATETITASLIGGIPNVAFGTTGTSIGPWSAFPNHTGLMRTHTDGTRHYLIMGGPAGETNEASTYVSTRPGGDLYLRANGNDNTRGLTLTNSGNSSTDNQTAVGDGGHSIRGRLTFLTDGVHSAGMWFGKQNGLLGFFGDDGTGLNRVGFYPGNGPGGFWPWTIDQNGRIVMDGTLNAADNAGLYAILPSNANPAGGISYNGFGRLTTTTSRRKNKRNIVDLEDALTTVEGLRPRSFTVKGQPLTDDPVAQAMYDLDVRSGFIVEELMEDAPGLVTYRMRPGGTGIADFEPEYYRTDDLLALAVKAIQELSTTVADLQTRLEALES